ncbi:MAG: glycosyltransferase family 4 protein [Candidatus Hydrogenedentes bacterium]|nr:glycosyltransferase family 4 protein [Candidatus Hydrogenedentota bacterium]
MALRIVQLARRFDLNDWGGTETVVAETSKQLLAMGHHTEILCTRATANKDGDTIGDLKITRYPYFYPYWGLSDAAINILDHKGGSPFSFSLMRALKSYPDPDLIHIHTGNRIGGIGRHVARKRRVPYVVSLHGGANAMTSASLGELAAPTKGAFDWGKVLGLWVGSRRVLNDAAAIICVGQDEQIATQKHYPRKKVIYLPNGVDIARFERGDGNAFRVRHSIPQDAFVILTVARIDAQKNQLGAAQALPGLLESVPNAHLLLIGPVANPAYHVQILEELKRTGLASRATIIEGVPAGSQDLVDAYHASNLFLLPSVHEPFGIVILEAWAAGLPVVASRVGGIPHFVSDGVDGTLFDVSAAGSMTQALATVAQNAAAQAAMVEAGAKKVRAEYGWDRITARLVSIYEDAIRENPFR